MNKEVQRARMSHNLRNITRIFVLSSLMAIVSVGVYTLLPYDEDRASYYHDQDDVRHYVDAGTDARPCVHRPNPCWFKSPKESLCCNEP